MPIRYYQVLQRALSQTTDVICRTRGIDRQEAFRQSEAYIQENSKKWRLTDPKIQYNDPFCRMAYLYMNVAIHATLLEQTLQSYSSLKNHIRDVIRSGRELKICAFGGGPGSELLGVVRLIEGLAIRRTAYLDFSLVDKIREWDESWHAIKLGIDGQLLAEYGVDRAFWPVLISRSFLPLDVTDLRDFRDYAIRFAEVDLFVFCYVFSELKEKEGRLGEVISHIAEQAIPGSYFLSLDRAEGTVRKLVGRVMERTPYLTPMGSREFRGRLQEDLHDLGEWYINIPHLPRRKWLAFSTLARREKDTKVSSQLS